ncbi:MAG: hypothetical protein KatS3mg111_2922 [Pirellulaceae bacterium]|nr:MAG: hypothetical protein KatS3mg111_2922 [Pirellulaceae bacterium]
MINPARLWTVGHSNLEPEAFIAMLQSHGVTAIADVRSHPFSRQFPHFNRESLKSWLEAAGIWYVFLGEELGARRSEPECYVDGQARYELIAQTPAFHAGLDRVRVGVQRQRIALMCAEKDPLTCHRAILVARALKSEMQIDHILSAEQVESHADMERRLMQLWNLDAPDFFMTPQERLEEAYQRQGRKIAYVEDVPE